jgi:hypothetical protein
MNLLLRQFHKGPLLVVVHISRVELYSQELNFRFIERGLTLFEYIGEACARIFTNMTTRLSVSVDVRDWMILEYLPKEGILQVFKIGGEPLCIEEDDPERLECLAPD